MKDPFRMLSIAVIVLGVGLFFAAVGIGVNSWQLWRLEQQIIELKR